MALMITGKTPEEVRDEIAKWLLWEGTTEGACARFAKKQGDKRQRIYAGDAIKSLAEQLMNIPCAASGEK